MGSEDRIDKIVGIASATVVGVILFCVFVVPTCVDQIAILLANEAYSKYGALLSTVVVIAIVGLIIGVVRFFSTSKE